MFKGRALACGCPEKREHACLTQGVTYPALMRAVVQSHWEKERGQCMWHILQMLTETGEEIFDISRSVGLMFKIYMSPNNGRQLGYFMVENNCLDRVSILSIFWFIFLKDETLWSPFPPYCWDDLSIYCVNHNLLKISGNFSLEIGGQRDFPGGPVVRAEPSSVGGVGLIPARRAEPLVSFFSS